MKELEKHNRDTEKESIEQVVVKQVQQEFHLIDSLRPVRGHTLWQINVKTLEVKPAEYKKNRVIDWWQAVKEYESGDVHTEVIIEAGCVYVSALNQENALKRYKEQKGSAQMNEQKPLSLF